MQFEKVSSSSFTNTPISNSDVWVHIYLHAQRTFIIFCTFKWKQHLFYYDDILQWGRYSGQQVNKWSLKWICWKQEKKKSKRKDSADRDKR